MKNPRRGFTLVELLVVIAIIGVLVAIMLPAVNGVREAARRMTCQSYVRQMAYAALNYEKANTKFPAGVNLRNKDGELLKTGTRYTSGMVELLPYVEENAAYRLYDPTREPWNQPNKRVTATAVGVFRCPSDPGSEGIMQHQNAEFSRSNFAFNFGSKTMFISDTNTDTDGPFREGFGRKLADLRDGTSKTVLFGEVLAGMANGGGASAEIDARGVWAFHQPGSALYMHRNPPNATQGDVLLSSGSQRYCVDDPDRRLPCDRSSGTKWAVLHAAARSAHVGGVNVSFADAHVSFYPDRVDPAVWKAIATIEGGEDIDITP